MAKKTDDDPTEEIETPDDGIRTVVVERSEAPNSTARPADKAGPNSTFAERAKAQGRNKRVETAEKK